MTISTQLSDKSNCQDDDKLHLEPLIDDPLVQILIFKTSINYPEEIIRLSKVVEGEPRIVKWNVDLEDCDKVLRIEGTNITQNEIITIIKSEGFDCEELMN